MFKSTQVRVLESHPVTPLAKPQPDYTPNISNPQAQRLRRQFVMKDSTNHLSRQADRVLNSLGQ
jgi:hypothetical protein